MSGTGDAFTPGRDEREPFDCDCPICVALARHTVRNPLADYFTSAELEALEEYEWELDDGGAAAAVAMDGEIIEGAQVYASDGWLTGGEDDD
jgi:hypothetical protein